MQRLTYESIRKTYTYLTTEILPHLWMEFLQKALCLNNMQRKACDENLDSSEDSGRQAEKSQVSNIIQWLWLVC